MSRNYWGFRINNEKRDFFMKELSDGRLRQGWGWDPRQDLRMLTMDEGAKRNRPMYEKVKEGDILLIPNLPGWGFVAIVEATHDWKSGYDYQIDVVTRDFGHIFPAKYLRKFSRHNENVESVLKTALKARNRFWGISNCKDNIDGLLNADESKLGLIQTNEEKLNGVIQGSFEGSYDKNKFKEQLCDNMHKKFAEKDWEDVLVYGLQQLFPFYQVENVGGVKEKQHGTDILIRIPGILNELNFGIAIQVKDYEGIVGNNVIDQINKAEYWSTGSTEENINIIQKVIIITKAEKKENTVLQGLADKSNIRIIMGEEIEELLVKIGEASIGIKNDL